MFKLNSQYFSSANVNNIKRYVTHSSICTLSLCFSSRCRAVFTTCSILMAKSFVLSCNGRLFLLKGSSETSVFSALCTKRQTATAGKFEWMLWGKRPDKKVHQSQEISKKVELIGINNDKTGSNIKKVEMGF